MNQNCLITKRHQGSGYSMAELLCVIAIISVLAAIYIGAIAKAFIHIKKFLDLFAAHHG